MTRDDALDVLKRHKSIFTHGDVIEAIDMAIDALSKPNYETDTEVRLAVVNSHKDRVILFDPFDDEEYVPKCVLEQIMWERDTALETLEDHGIGLGQRADLLSHEEAWKRVEQTDLISREDAINAFDDGYVYYKKGIRYRLEQVPSAEPTVIRCKDCRWYKVGKSEVDSWQICGHPCREYENVTDDDFCSWAERGDINQ